LGAGAAEGADEEEMRGLMRGLMGRRGADTYYGSGGT
jgi:hypothetical protein